MLTTILALALCLTDLQGRAVSVADGDTVTVLDSSNTQHKIRLAGIDAPEKKQPWGARSKENLSRLVYGQQVTVEGSKTDRYGRRIGKVTINDTDANLEQIRAGLAWWYRQYRSEQSLEDQRAYAAAETEAREAKRGLWAEPEPIAPWDWRKARKATSPRP